MRPDLNELSKEIHSNNVSVGWWDTDKDGNEPCIYEKLQLVSTEIAEATLTYYKEVDTLVATTDTNVLLTNGIINTSVLYRALAALFSYVHDEEEELYYLQKYAVEIASIQESYDGEEWSGDTLAINRGGC